MVFLLQSGEWSIRLIVFYRLDSGHEPRRRIAINATPTTIKQTNKTTLIPPNPPICHPSLPFIILHSRPKNF